MIRLIGARYQSQWRFLASLTVGAALGGRPRASQEPPLDPLSPLRCPSQCTAAKRPTGAEREGGFMSLAAYPQCWVSTNAHPVLQGAPSLPV